MKTMIQLSGAEINYGERQKILSKAKSFARTEKVKSFEINVKKYDTSGKRAKYSIHIKAMTEHGLITAKGDGWQINLAMKDAINRLGKQCEKSNKLLKKA